MQATERPTIKHEYKVYLIMGSEKFLSKTYKKELAAVKQANKLELRYGHLGYTTEIETREMKHG